MEKGDKVVCINDSKSGGMPFDFNYPVKDKIYTIRGIHPDGGGVYLEEISNIHIAPLTPMKCEPGFKHFRFRKIDYDFVYEVISKIKEEPISV